MTQDGIALNGITLAADPAAFRVRPSATFSIVGELTLLDLILIVQEFSDNDHETAQTVSSLLSSGRVRLRSPR